MNISDVRKSTGWGSFGDFFQFSLSANAGVVLSVRHLRICKGSDDPWVPTMTMPADVASIFELGLPVVNIETVDGEEPTCDYVDHPAGSFGAGITNTTKVPGKLDIYASNSTTPDYTSGEYKKDVSGMTIRYRGNTSAYSGKKPYKIKLQKKANLMLRGKDKTYKDKDWLLINVTNLYTAIGHKMNALLGLQWAPRYRYVNVIMNGDYRGLYLLVESVKRNTDARINVAEDGFITELDPYWWNEDGQYLTSKFNPQCNYTFKYPDWEDMTEATKDYIQSTLTTFENSIAQGTYTKYIDMESFASWLIARDVLGSLDGAGGNMFFTKYDSSDASLIRMGNLWDFDGSEDATDMWSSVHSYFFGQFFKSQNKAFARAYVKRWNEIKDTFFTGILNFVDSIAASDEGKGYAKSMTYNNVRWGLTYRGIDIELKQRHSWFDRRKEWMETAMATIDTSWFVKEQTITAGRFITIQAEDYCEGGKDVAYHSHNTTSGTYRADNEGVSLVSASGYGKKWAIADMGADWDSDGQNLTRAEAIEKWGAWYTYTFIAHEDMDIAINLKAGVDYSTYGQISALGSESSIVGEPGITNWVKRYAASAIVLLDGDELKPNQKTHPVNTANNAAAYAKLLQDKSQWTANSTTENVLYFYPNSNNLNTSAPYYQKKVYGEPDNFTAKVTRGRHTICVKSLASGWLFDEMTVSNGDWNALSDVHAPAFTLRAEGTVIHICSPKPGSTVEVFDVTGRLVYKGTASAVDVRISGVYVVRVDGECGKVLVR